MREEEGGEMSREAIIVLIIAKSGLFVLMMVKGCGVIQRGKGELDEYAWMWMMCMFWMLKFFERIGV